MELARAVDARDGSYRCCKSLMELARVVDARDVIGGGSGMKFLCLPEQLSLGTDCRSCGYVEKLVRAADARDTRCLSTVIVNDETEEFACAIHSCCGSALCTVVEELA